MRQALVRSLKEGSLPIPAWLIPDYWFMLTLAIISGSVVAVLLWRHSGQKGRVASDLIFYGILGLFAGAKFSTIYSSACRPAWARSGTPEALHSTGGYSGCSSSGSSTINSGPTPSFHFSTVSPPLLPPDCSWDASVVFWRAATGASLVICPGRLAFPGTHPSTNIRRRPD